MICLQKKEYNFDILKQGSERFRFWLRQIYCGPTVTELSWDLFHSLAKNQAVIPIQTFRRNLTKVKLCISRLCNCNKNTPLPIKDKEKSKTNTKTLYQRSNPDSTVFSQEINMRVKQSFMTPHCETTGKNVKKCKIQEFWKAKFT